MKRAKSLFDSFYSVVAKQSCTLFLVARFTKGLGSLNNDGDGIENGKKPTTLRTGTASKTGNKTNNFARASHFFVNLFVVVTHKTS